MAHRKFCLFVLALSAVSCEAGIYLRKGRPSDAGLALEGNLSKTILYVPRNGTSVSLPTFERIRATSVATNRLTAAALPMHSAPTSSSKTSYSPRDFVPLAEHCMPTVVPIQSLPNGTVEDFMSSIVPGLMGAFPNHTMIVQLYQVGLTPGLHLSTITTANNGTAPPATNVTASATGTSKPLSFTDFVDTLSNIVSIVTSCVQTWFQFRNLGELRRLFLPRLAPLAYLAHLRHLPMLALVAQDQANLAVAVARPAPAARPR